MNEIRHEHAALQFDRSLRFHQTDNRQLICYSKQSPDGSDLILTIVNLDPHNMQHGFIRLPLIDWGLSPESHVEVRDLLSNERYFWRGEWNYVRLDPEARAGHILHVQIPGKGDSHLLRPNPPRKGDCPFSADNPERR